MNIRPIKRYGVNDWIHKQDAAISFLCEIHLLSNSYILNNFHLSILLQLFLLLAVIVANFLVGLTYKLTIINIHIKKK